jgi:hypothetical protein
MATSKKEGKGGTNALYWIGGVAATAGVYYFATRYLRERDELMEMRLMQKLKAPGGNPELPEAEGE